MDSGLFTEDIFKSNIGTTNLTPVLYDDPASLLSQESNLPAFLKDETGPLEQIFGTDFKDTSFRV